MPIFITQGNYSRDAILRLVCARPRPHKRFGEYDFIAISGFPDENAAPGSVLVAGSSGAVTSEPKDLARD